MKRIRVCDACGGWTTDGGDGYYERHRLGCPHYRPQPHLESPDWIVFVLPALVLLILLLGRFCA